MSEPITSEASMAKRASERTSTYLTESQVEAMRLAMDRDEYSSVSEWIRDLIRDRIERKGLKWPDEDVQWGGFRTPKDGGEDEYGEEAP